MTTALGFLGSNLCRASLAVPEANLPRPRPKVWTTIIGSKNLYYSGPGAIAGTVKEKGSPDKPVRRRVRLHLKSTGVLIKEMWSDLAGNYAFNNLDTTVTYYVVAFDHNDNYNAVIKDSIKPEVP